MAPDAVKQDVIEIVSRRVDAFALDDIDIGQTTVVEDRNETGNSITFSERARPIPNARRKFVETELQRLSTLGIISAANPGVCPYASPIVVVPKKDGGLRM